MPKLVAAATVDVDMDIVDAANKLVARLPAAAVQLPPAVPQPDAVAAAAAVAVDAVVLPLPPAVLPRLAAAVAVADALPADADALPADVLPADAALPLLAVDAVAIMAEPLRLPLVLLQAATWKLLRNPRQNQLPLLLSQWPSI